MQNKEAILEIRKKIPIGLKAAKNLLEQTNFDIQEAVLIWKRKQVEIFVQKNSVAPEEARKLLKEVNYDFAKALSVYKDQNTTEIEKILLSSKKEEQVLANFWTYISDYLGENVWITKDEFEKLPELIRNILVVWQWYAYYDYEGISVEQSITNDVIQILELKFEMNDFAKELNSLKIIVDLFNKENLFNKNNFEKYIELKNQLTSSEKYKYLDNKIEANENLVMKKLYNSLKNNSKQINELFKNIKDGRNKIL